MDEGVVQVRSFEEAPIDTLGGVLSRVVLAENSAEQPAALVTTTVKVPAVATVIEDVVAPVDQR